MHEVIPLQVKPKRESHAYNNHRYVLQFEPNATPDKRWSWVVSYTHTFHYFGAAPTLDQASRGAKMKINKLLRRQEIVDAG